MAAPPGEDALLADAQSWAATRLELAEGESRSTSQLLACLANHSFLPGVSDHEALRLLIEPAAAATNPSSLESTAGSAFEQYLRAKIEQFAGELCCARPPKGVRSGTNSIARHCRSTCLRRGSKACGPCSRCVRSRSTAVRRAQASCVT